MSGQVGEAQGPELITPAPISMLETLKAFASANPFSAAKEFDEICERFQAIAASIPPRHVPLEERIASWLLGTWRNATRPFRWALADRLESLERKLRRG